jgi:Phosphate-selective porin O and P
MSINKLISRAAGASLAAIILFAVGPLYADPSSDSERLEKLERAVEQLQERNAELEQEVKSLKKMSSFAPELGAEGKTKTKIYSDGKTYVEKNVLAEEKPPIYVVPGGPEFKLTLGGYIQAQFEDGDVSAFEGRFGLAAIKDRFRLRRARITLTGDYGENFDFKIQGDFEQSDSAITALQSITTTVDKKTGDIKTIKTTTTSNSSRTGFSGTDIFINWHQFPEAQFKIGQWKAPFGLEQITPDEVLFTIERSLPTGAITPERQIGAQLWGKPFTHLWPEQSDFLTYYAGVFNGNGRNTSVNDNNNFMTVGRLELLPYKGKIFGQDASLKLGGDVLNSRDDKGTNISQTLNLLVNKDGSLSPFVLPGADERTAWSADAWLNIGPFDLIGEYLAEDVDGRTVNGVAPGFKNFDPSGWYVQGSYYIIPKKLQGIVKWEGLDPNQVDDDSIHSITAGLNYYIHGHSIKLMADYVHTWSDFRAARPKLELGDDNFDEFIARLQVIF